MLLRELHECLPIHVVLADELSHTLSVGSRPRAVQEELKLWRDHNALLSSADWRETTLTGVTIIRSMPLQSVLSEASPRP
jgi:hypothetical protein